MSKLRLLSWSDALSLLQGGFLVSTLPTAFLRFVDPPTTVIGPLLHLRSNDYFEAGCERPHDRWRWRKIFYSDSTAEELFKLPFPVRWDHVVGLEGLIEVPFESRREQRIAPCKRGILTFSEKRTLEKAESRQQDADDLASGRKTREQLRKENGAFAFPPELVTVDYSGRKF